MVRFSFQFQDNLSLYGDRVIAIIEQDDRGEIFRFQAGNIGPNTKTGIASCTKWLSGAVVLICAERGYIRLDDRIGQYLPIFDTYGKGDITIRQCFAMKSGLQLNGPEYETDPTLTLVQSVDLSHRIRRWLFRPAPNSPTKVMACRWLGAAARSPRAKAGASWRAIFSSIRSA